MNFQFCLPCCTIAHNPLLSRYSIMEGQDSFIMREFEDAEVDFGEDGGDVVADVGLSSHCIYPTSRLLLSGPFSSLVLEKIA